MMMLPVNDFVTSSLMLSTTNPHGARPRSPFNVARISDRIIQHFVYHRWLLYSPKCCFQNTPMEFIASVVRPIKRLRIWNNTNEMTKQSLMMNVWKEWLWILNGETKLKASGRLRIPSRCGINKTKHFTNKITT